MLRLLYWNVRDIISLTLSVYSLLEKSKCDITILSEHKHSKHSVNYLNSIHSNYYSILKIDSDSEDSHVLRHCGKGGVAILINKNLQFSTREIPCLATNSIVGIQVTFCDTLPLFIFSVYLPSDNVLDDYKANIDIMQYEQYCQYGKVLFAGDFNESLLREFHVNNAKSEILRKLVKRCALCTPMIDFRVEGEQFTFTPKDTMIDYILFDCKIA